MPWCLALLAMTILNLAHAAGCDRAPDSSEIGVRFTLEEALTHDKSTRLTWQRCGVGRHYQAGRCAGTLKLLTLDQARQAARQAGPAWRVPTVDELASLLKKHCKGPRINRIVFPDVEVSFEGKSKYWSVSRDRDIPTLTYNIDFLSGQIDGNTSGIAMGVRLVRSR